MYRSLADAVRDAEAQASRSRSSRSRPSPTIRAVRSARFATCCAARCTSCRARSTQGLDGDLQSASGLVGGDAAKLVHGPPGPLAGTPFRDVLARALAVQEVNAAMGVIVAAPTAGGAGVLPAVLTGSRRGARTCPTTRSSTRSRPRD